MNIFSEEFSFSPRNPNFTHKSLPNLASTEEPNIESYLNSPRNLLDHLLLKQERHEALKNYYSTIIAQLHDFVKSSISQLDTQKADLINEIEHKYHEAVKDIQIRANKKEQELLEKHDEASLHLEQVTTILKKFELGYNDRETFKEAEENLKLWASEVQISANNVLFPVPILSLSISEYSEFKSLTKNIQISSVITEVSPLHNINLKKTKLFVPFGTPAYSCYYLINLNSSVYCSSFSAAISAYLGIESIEISYKNGGNFIQHNEKIQTSTKELYLTIKY